MPSATWAFESPDGSASSDILAVNITLKLPKAVTDHYLELNLIVVLYVCLALGIVMMLKSKCACRLGCGLYTGRSPLDVWSELQGFLAGETPFSIHSWHLRTTPLSGDMLQIVKPL